MFWRGNGPKTKFYLIFFIEFNASNYIQRKKKKNNYILNKLFTQIL